MITISVNPGADEAPQLSKEAAETVTCQPKDVEEEASQESGHGKDDTHMYGASEQSIELHLQILRDLLPPPLALSIEGQKKRRRDLKARRKVDKYYCNIEKVLTRDQLNNIYPTKRPKERTMRELIRFLSQWRLLHQGVYVKREAAERRLQKFELKESARLIGISNKTLDDYQL